MERAKKAVSAWFHWHVERCHECRQCGARVEFFGKICQICGSHDPVRIPLSTSLWTGGTLLAVLLLALLILGVSRF